MLFIQLAITVNATIMPVNQNSPNGIDSLIHKKVKLFMEDNGVPGSAVILYKNGEIRKYFFGYSNLEQKTPVSAHSIFELGSITKTFTGLLLAKKVHDKELQFDDSLVALLGGNPNLYSPSITNISLLELATHTSGLPFNAPNLPYDATSSMQNVMRLHNFLQQWKSSYPPSKYMRYSNLGFSLLAMALANSEHMALSNLIEEDILVPLGMSDAGLALSVKAHGLYCMGYTANNAPVQIIDMGSLGGSWAMKASPMDMEAYLKLAVMDARMPTDLLVAMKNAEQGYYQFVGNEHQIGLGWSIIPLDNKKKYDDLVHAPIAHKRIPMSVERIDDPVFNGNALIDKTGATDGFRAYIGVIPNEHLGIVILTNKFIANSGALQNTARAILLHLAK